MQNWMQHGRCRELSPSTFFPGDGVGVEIARRVCAECAVREPCLEYALAERIDHGVWGGTSEREQNAASCGVVFETTSVDI